jgi:4-amino-4-deoxy-L-arabinose transferase-like glycosyltransferase
VDRRSGRLVACWVLATVVFFSLSPAKRSVYVLQAYPALALLVGGGLAVLSVKEPGRVAISRWLAAPSGVLGLILVAAAVAVLFLAPRQPEAALLPATVPVRIAVTITIMAAGAGVATLLGRRGRLAGAAGVLGAGFGASMLVAALTVLPAIDPLKSVRQVAEHYLEHAQPGETYGFFPAQEPALQFYTGRFGHQLSTEEELRTFLAGKGRVWLFVERGSLERLERPLAAEEVVRGADPENGYILFVSQRDGRVEASRANAGIGREGG